MKTADKKRVHLICNAHIDPVWLWEWQEGAAEAISTFRTAVELCEKNHNFVFNHNEAILYMWIEEYEPELFARIREQVKAGRWNIMGGWYLQPDCNMLCGESFVRQIIYGKRYFKKEFGVDVTTAINFDPFGHTRGLVQILAKSGFDSYIFGRPREELKLPDHQFVWVGYEGSEVLATRFLGWYNTKLGQAAPMISQRIQDAPTNKNVIAVLWGVGNHGGGPSRHDLKEINKLIKDSKDIDIIHSTPQRYFEEISDNRENLPKWNKDLNPWAVGCYTSMIRVKQAHRQLENELYMCEKMAMAATLAGLMEYPTAELEQATKDLMFCQFHDILPGSAIQPVEEASLRKMSRGLENLSNVKTRAFFALARGQKRAAHGQISVLVYNPHPYRVATIVECEFNLPDCNDSGTWFDVQVYSKGGKLPTQVEHEMSNLAVDWRKRIVFSADLEPSTMNRFDCTVHELAQKPAPVLKANNGIIRFKTDQLDIVINKKTGLLDRYRIDGIDYLKRGAMCPIVIQDNTDPWGMSVSSFRKIAGKFKLLKPEAAAKLSGMYTKTESVRIIEDGPVRSVIEVLMGFEESFICQRYKLPKIGTEIEVEIIVHWNQKDQMLKFNVPLIFQNAKYLGQTAFGIGELATNGREVVAQKWVAVVNNDENKAFTCINDGVYGSDYSKKGLNLTLLRSPAYSYPITNKEHLNIKSYCPRIDQGERIFRFWFNAGEINSRMDSVDREALIRNEKPFALSFYPSGLGKKVKSLMTLDDRVVQISSVIPSEDEKNILFRLFEPTGKPRTAVMNIPILGMRIKIGFGGFEIKTLKINLKNKKHEFVNLIEK